MSNALKELAKRAAFRYTPLGAPRYPYNIEPLELATLIQELERVKDLPGVILEVGVARGMTTRFICEHLLQSQRTSERLYAIDTFESFKPDDMDYEIHVRGKKKSDLAGFNYIEFERWKQNFEEFPFVTACKADCSTFDYASIGPIKLAFLDVDLYLPTKQALGKIYDELCDGGVILVDDVKNNASYDGAYQAYVEFCSERFLPAEIIGVKCGLVRK
jgi:O-methyltransferase